MVSPATAKVTDVFTDGGATLGEGREIVIASPGSPFDSLHGRVENVNSHGHVLVSVPGKGFLQLFPDEIRAN